MDDPMDAYYATVRENIKKYGFVVQGVLPSADTDPVTYTIGLWPKIPELYLSGQPTDTGHWLLNQLAARLLKEPELAHADVLIGGIVEGYDVKLVRWSGPNSLWNAAVQIHGGPDFGKLRVLWPDADHRFPDDPDCISYVARIQGYEHGVPTL